MAENVCMSFFSVDFHFVRIRCHVRSSCSPEYVSENHNTWLNGSWNCSLLWISSLHFFESVSISKTKLADKITELKTIIHQRRHSKLGGWKSLEWEEWQWKVDKTKCEKKKFFKAMSWHVVVILWPRDEIFGRHGKEDIRLWKSGHIWVPLTTQLFYYWKQFTIWFPSFLIIC